MARPLHMESGWLTRADGSSKFAFGSQCSAASVSGPIEVRIRDELTDSATFQVGVTPLDGNTGIATTALAAEIESLYKAVVLLHHYPRSLIQLSVQTTSSPSQASSTVQLSWDGRLHDNKETEARMPLLLGPDSPFLASETAASINASTLALLDANIPMRATVVATACAVLRREDVDPERDLEPYQSDIHCIVVDPTPLEEHKALSTHTYAFAISGFEPLIANTSNVTTELVYCSSQGPSDARLRSKLYSYAEKSVLLILQSIRSHIESRFE